MALENEPPRRKQRGISGRYHSIRRKRRGIQPEEIKIVESDDANEPSKALFFLAFRCEISIDKQNPPFYTPFHRKQVLTKAF